MKKKKMKLAFHKKRKKKEREGKGRKKRKNGIIPYYLVAVIFLRTLQSAAQLSACQPPEQPVTCRYFSPPSVWINYSGLPFTILYNTDTYNTYTVITE